MKRLVWSAFVCLAFASSASNAQSISDQKQVVAFLFGTVHPVDSGGIPLKDPSGKPLALEQPLGTAFFVSYPDKRGGPDYLFSYLVTAKHVLRDSDGKFLRAVNLRLNLKSASGKGIEFVKDIPVSDANGSLLWFHDLKDNGDEAVVLPFLPDQAQFEFKTVPLAMFADDETIKMEKLAEGDTLYFIGLMAQFYGSERNFPVIRRGTLALMTDEKMDTPWGPERAFIAELNSWPGNSGSPVFLNLSGFRDAGTIIGPPNIRFMGILLGNFQNKLKATTVDSFTAVLGNDANIGVSFMLPASRVREVLEGGPAQQNRDIQIQQLGRSR